MKRKQGFTLVELLVVMAIIAILASIVVPNVAKYIAKSRMTRALSEIKGMELALTDLLTQAKRSSLQHLFDPDGVRGYMGIAAGTVMTDLAFVRAQEVYTNVLYALLREGRAALADGDALVGDYSQYLRDDVIRNLGTGGMNIGFDPWGELYKIWPGPWPRQRTGESLNVIPFRIYRVEKSGGNALPGSGQRRRGTDGDELSFRIEDPETLAEETVGYPAPSNLSVYIYSTGANLVTGQVVYSGVPDFYDLANPLNSYEGAQEPEFAGGGDDVNNWDEARSWERFYN